MTENDFIKLGLKDPRDLDLLSACSKALSSHIEQQQQKQKQQKYYLYQTIEEENEEEVEDDDDLMIEDFFSMSSRLSSRSNSTTSDETALMTPSSITKAINAFDSYHSNNNIPSPEIVVIPSIQTNTSPAASSSATSLRMAAPGTVITRPNKQLLNSGSRPVSMPIQLPSFTSPPPDYFTSTSVFGRPLDRCRSMIFPREEEGKEELPGYSCTVFKMGYVYVKKELDSPTTKSRYRAWR
jgi:hypothetical protein